MGLFKSEQDKQIDALKAQVQNLTADCANWQKSWEKRNDKDDYEEEKRKIEAGQAATVAKYEKENVKRTHEDAIARVNANKDVEIAKVTADLNKEITKLTIENGSLKKENEMLTKAFANLGFDVKDMKSILDSLVKGLVAKNEIKVIATK